MLRPTLWITALALTSQAVAHDIWIETDQPRYKVNGLVTFNLMLGNHGNHHRDFRLASVLAQDKASLTISNKLPGGFSLARNLKQVQVGEDKYWRTSAQFLTGGLYVASATFDQVMSYAPVRDIKSAKTYFWVGPQDVQTEILDFKSPLGHEFEIVPLTDPAKSLSPGQEITVQVLYQGRPSPNTVVSFIPKGETLNGDFDPLYERKTDQNGRATHQFAHYGQHLVAAHYKDPEAQGPGYKGINYSATLHLTLPAQTHDHGQ